jgi:hypothetical protein
LPDLFLQLSLGLTRHLDHTDIRNGDLPGLGYDVVVDDRHAFQVKLEDGNPHEVARLQSIVRLDGRDIARLRVLGVLPSHRGLFGHTQRVQNDVDRRRGAKAPNLAGVQSLDAASGQAHAQSTDHEQHDHPGHAQTANNKS